MSIKLATYQLTAADIWSYSTRTLTQAKFPFWSAIITQQAGNVSVAGNTTACVDIQPPAGETWQVEFAFAILYPTAGEATYEDFDGTTARTHVSNYTSETPFLIVNRIITNSLYARLCTYNEDSISYTMYYGYSGFKLSKPLYSLQRSNDTPKPWKRKTQYPIPDAVKALGKYIVDVYDHRIGDYRQAIILEEDTPLAVDPSTGFAVERLTAYAFVDEFIKNVLTPYKQGALDLAKTGWKKYFDKWASEGVKL